MNYRFYIYWEAKYYLRQFLTGFSGGSPLIGRGILYTLVSDLIYLIYWLFSPIMFSLFRLVRYNKGAPEGLLIALILHGGLSGLNKANFEDFERKGRFEAVLALPHSLERFLQGWILGGLVLTYAEAVPLSILYIIAASFVAEIGVFQIPAFVGTILVIPGLSFMTSVSLKVVEDFKIGKNLLRYPFTYLRAGLGFGLIPVAIYIKVDLFAYLWSGILVASLLTVGPTWRFVSGLKKEEAVSKWTE